MKHLLLLSVATQARTDFNPEIAEPCRAKSSGLIIVQMRTRISNAFAKVSRHAHFQGGFFIVDVRIFAAPAKLDDPNHSEHWGSTMRRG
ncbi:hypothetical protein [Cereibacter johrii]|uniref:hypothetical protein n=1 Tax=Cereibacter johrii TaxID=445629 RepID=UPI00114CEF9D|nr:hypothetical protein [Cereibacter johrii]MEA5162419.1 hypothetical protein [Cereibacter johrii]